MTDRCQHYLSALYERENPHRLEETGERAYEKTGCYKCKGETRRDECKYFTTIEDKANLEDDA